MRVELTLVSRTSQVNSQIRFKYNLQSLISLSLPLSQSSHTILDELSHQCDVIVSDGLRIGETLRNVLRYTNFVRADEWIRRNHRTRAIIHTLSREQKKSKYEQSNLSEFQLSTKLTPQSHEKFKLINLKPLPFPSSACETLPPSSQESESRHSVCLDLAHSQYLIV